MCTDEDSFHVPDMYFLIFGLSEICHRRLSAAESADAVDKTVEEVSCTSESDQTFVGEFGFAGIGHTDLDTGCMRVLHGIESRGESVGEYRMCGERIRFGIQGLGTADRVQE
jgi:hypothetical protein